MGIYLQVEELTKSVGDRVLFADVTFGVNEGDKIGIVAKNGTGKTTLLRCLAGEISADSGKITYQNDVDVAMLAQTPQFPEGATPLTICRRVAERVEDPTERWEREEEMKRLLHQMDITDFDMPLAQMSGGQTKRIALAEVIVKHPKLLLLDEPTNHLDIATVEWLENYLRRSRITLLMVTHDRYFLDNVCNKIIEMDRGSTYTHDGNYAYYMRRRAERIAAMSEELAKVKNTLRKEQDWMNRQPQARAGKAKYRIDAFHDLKRRSQVNLKEKNVNLDVKSSYIGSKIFEAEGVGKRFGDKVILDDFTYNFARYDKVGIVGRNGVGKSTFIKMLQGLIEADCGTWTIGETVKFGYYRQEGIQFDEQKRVIDAVTEIAEDIVVNDGVHYSPMQFLQHFLFSPADQQKYIHTLSGGEKARLHLAAVLMRSPNFLILDEPTNDLDIVTLGILEDYLANFKGCVIVVSHDRFFLDSIVDHLFVMEGDGVVKDFPGNYSEYREYVDRQAKESQNSSEDKTLKDAKNQERRRDNRKERMSFKERKEFEQLTTDIEALTAEKEELEAAFNSGEAIADIADKAARYEAVKAELDEKEMRWLELSEKE